MHGPAADEYIVERGQRLLDVAAGGDGRKKLLSAAADFIRNLGISFTQNG